ncbi:beta-1,4-mannosyltransferase egh-like [Anopheles cruzii]|uniref:beta-1,4-mannosyltransferase egh-like n=1 Tax=Anopheles cruzii TaxID=68878 RepID=UPI0022EC9510|nr:beta-1,4-mannosyltransferase egh-like [Anopheles cruzii]
MSNSVWKHLLHCALLLVTITVVFKVLPASTGLSIDPWAEYGTVTTIALYLLRLPTLLALPQVLFNFFGLTVYNAFREKVVLSGCPLLAPFICLRVVTRGEYPDLVQSNVRRNLHTCTEAGLSNFLLEVVTDRPIGIPKNHRTREIVVPKEYRTTSGAMFKARALQYCLEKHVDVLSDRDTWVVHLDEETLLTAHSVRGILNFVLTGRHPFGQGLVTYANGHVVNWLTTLADSFRVSDDMGKLRLQFKLFHKPLFGWKGSYVVAQLQAEKDVSFDNGIDGSLAEDCFFAMRAYALGYTFDFIEGEMHEKSPFTLVDFLQQRKRWLQGILLVVRSPKIPPINKLLLGISLYSWITMPLAVANGVFIAHHYPIPCPILVEYVNAFVAGCNAYMYLFGVIKSFPLHRFGVLKSVACLCGALCIIPVNVLIETGAVILGLLGTKNKFYVVQKEVARRVTV